MQMSPSFLTFCRATFWINKPPATKWTLLFLAPNAGPLSRQRAPRGKPLTARGAAGQTTRKWTASWKRFNSTPSKATSISMDFYGFTATEKKRTAVHATAIFLCVRSRWPPALWRPSRLLSADVQHHV